MPRYDYRCVACGNEVEVMHGIDGSGPESCTVCGEQMRKAVSAPAIHFKGSGWAKKDARAAATAAAAPKTDNDAKDGTGTATDGGEADAAATSESSTGGDGDASTDTSGASDGAAAGSGATSEAAGTSTAPE